MALSYTTVVLCFTSLSFILPRLTAAVPTPSFKTDLADSQVLSDAFPYYFPDEEEEGNLFPMPFCNGLKLEEATIDEIQSWLSHGQLNSIQLCACYLQRREQTDQYINTVLELNPDWPMIAMQLDGERQAGQVRGPLHGIPFLVKDNIASKDKMQTTSGSWALLGSIVPRDAHVVSQLRTAGAILLGKATLSEWADMRSNNYSEGYSGRGGQARSPYNLTVNPGGSSSGSAGAVAANIVTFALGTETDGSVINPAERNALVGIKPTVGLTSRAGVIPESTHQDTVGTFARTVRDAVYALDAIYGVDARDNYTQGQVGQAPTGGYTQFLTDKNCLQGAVFGLPWQSFWSLADPGQVDQLTQLIQLLKDAGATVINGTELPNYESIVDFYNNIKSYLSELDNTNIRSLEDIVQYNIENVGSEGGTPGINPAFGSGQDGFIASVATKGALHADAQPLSTLHSLLTEFLGYMDETYYQALAFCQHSTRAGGIDAALQHNGTKISALLVPPDVAQTYQIAAQAGYPVITIPAGLNSASGMPFGLALMNTAWSEPILIRYASAIEDLQRTSGTRFRRTVPQWLGYNQRNIPVINA
ncbi:hypothetical protein MMC09_006367 [Bachmanniomyces sp. S44760]|nr:hypothetical protein [Bachmanniomyces sp. S44760]